MELFDDHAFAQIPGQTAMQTDVRVPRETVCAYLRKGDRITLDGQERRISHVFAGSAEVLIEFSDAAYPPHIICWLSDPVTVR